MLHFDFEDGQGYVPARRHINGGGIISITAEVADTVFVAADAMVYGYAKVTDHVRITGRARISGDKFPCGISTLIEDHATLCGNVIIKGCVLISNHAQIRGHVKIQGGVQVAHHAIVAGNVELLGDVLVLDRGYISGNIKIIGDDRQVVVRGEDVVHGDRTIKSTEGVRTNGESDKSKKRGKQKIEFDVRADRYLSA